LIYKTTPSNRYATFFYGQFDPQHQRLTYVNAGHNAPVVLRCGPGRRPECLRLEAGGPPVGLLATVSYESATIDLQPEDVVVLFTDGISEAMNDAGEEWGDEELIGALAGCAGKAPTEIVDEVFRAADAFANGAAQHDDMTVVVCCVRPEQSASAFSPPEVECVGMQVAE
jgi:sigma-B regulation protein RsbU (phosphoserine phosphatase)